MKRRSYLWLAFVVGVALVSGQVASAQQWAKDRVDKSPRHLEYVKVKQGKREVTCFVAYPEVKEKTTTIVVIHEIFGLSDWARSLADQLAEAGYVAIAPDLLSGSAPGGGGTAELGGGDAVRRAFAALPPEQITADLNAVVEHVGKLPASNGKVAVCGFCWGGGQTFRFATNNKSIKAAFSFYGSTPLTEADVARIACPVYGFYAGNDARVNMSIPKATELMKSGGKTFEPVTYEGAGHGFMRGGDDPNGRPGDKKARDLAWKRLKELLAKL